MFSKLLGGVKQAIETLGSSETYYRGKLRFGRGSLRDFRTLVLGNVFLHRYNNALNCMCSDYNGPQIFRFVVCIDTTIKVKLASDCKGGI